MKTQIFCLFAVISVCNAGDEIRDLVRTGEISSTVIESLTEEEVPEKWKTSVTEETEGDSARLAYSRGGVQKLVIGWNRNWGAERESMFWGWIMDGGKRVGSIVGQRDSVSIPNSLEDNEYSQIVDVSKEGVLSVIISKNGDLFEVVRVDGRKSSLIGDLEFTKAKLSETTFVKPLLQQMMSDLSDVRESGLDETDHDETSLVTDGSDTISVSFMDQSAATVIYNITSLFGYELVLSEELSKRKNLSVILEDLSFEEAMDLVTDLAALEWSFDGKRVIVVNEEDITSSGRE